MGSLLQRYLELRCSCYLRIYRQYTGSVTPRFERAGTCSQYELTILPTINVPQTYHRQPNDPPVITMASSEPTEHPKWDIHMQHILDLGQIPRNYYRYVDPELWADPVTPESTPERSNSYVIERICGYESARAFDEDLFFLFQEDFEGWTITHFAALSVDIRRFLKDTLRTRGVYTGLKKGKTQVALANLAIAEDLPEWNAEEAATTPFDRRSKQWTGSSPREETEGQPKETNWNPTPREQRIPEFTKRRISAWATLTAPVSAAAAYRSQSCAGCSPSSRNIRAVSAARSR